MGMCRSYKIGENAMMYNMYNALTAAGPASSSKGEEEAAKRKKRLDFLSRSSPTPPPTPYDEKYVRKGRERRRV
jgi:hypothetical protein